MTHRKEHQKEEHKRDDEKRETNGSKQRLRSTLLATLQVFGGALLLFAAHSSLSSNADAATTTRSRLQDHRRLLEVGVGNIPSYMEPLMQDLKERKKLMEETPPEEVKYWFEYTGPLQVSEKQGEGEKSVQYLFVGMGGHFQHQSIVHPKIEVILRLRTRTHHQNRYLIPFTFPHF